MPNTYTIHAGKQQEVLLNYQDNYFGALVTDPPYGLKFMGKKWDYQVPTVDEWKSVYRVMKPGAYGVVFCGTRTQHRMVCNMEDAGFEIRDVLAWVYGSGFPKGQDIGKLFDKDNGLEREIIGTTPAGSGPMKTGHVNSSGGGMSVGTERSPEIKITTAASDEAKQWDGWNSALKPAMELITLIRKPLQGTTIENIRAHGVGAINIDGCRVPIDMSIDDPRLGGNGDCSSGTDMYSGKYTGSRVGSSEKGRYPANLIHDGSPEATELFPVNAGAAAPVKSGQAGDSNGIYGDFASKWDDGASYYGAKGSAARFFYCAKASTSERNAGTPNGNPHTTVKPMTLMQYLVKLITPPGETVLDPYAGSGTTGCASLMEGRDSILIDQDDAHAATIGERMNHWQKQAFKGIQSDLLT